MILNIVLIISSYLALFFSIIIFVKKNKHVSDYYLASWLLVLSAYMISLGYFPTINIIFSLLHSVFLFLYIKSITSKSGLKTIYLLYFLPSILFSLFYFLYPDYNSITISKIIQAIISPMFIIASYISLYKYQIYLKKNYANINHADINWLYLLFYGVLFFYIISASVHFLNFIPNKAIYSISLFLFMNITGIKAIRQNSIFIKRLVENIEKSNTGIYANYGLKDTYTLSEKLRIYMETIKPYINQELCLNDLSKALDVYPHYITQVLSIVFNQNFYDYINTYRVEEAKKQLKDSRNSNLTILSIAFDCGFNSKTAFNRAFKQKTNQTPSEYRSSKY